MNPNHNERHVMKKTAKAVSALFVAGALTYRVVFDDLGGSGIPHTWKFVIDPTGTDRDRTLQGKSSKFCR